MSNSQVAPAGGPGTSAHRDEFADFIPRDPDDTMTYASVEHALRELGGKRAAQAAMLRLIRGR